MWEEQQEGFSPQAGNRADRRVVMWEEQQEGFSPQAGNRADRRVGCGKSSRKGSAHKQEIEQIGELDVGRTAGRVQPTSRK
uniref:Uncharacterized protein n=1 Tax=Xenopus tropicalis TaxID=8364 RepID=A0A1B8XZJ4_XENTR